MTYLWILRKDQTWIGLYQNRVETLLRNIFIFWAVYCSEINIRPEAC